LIVVDASIVASALADDGIDGDRARDRLIDERLAAPELIDLEVASVWRRALRAGRLPTRRAGQALADLAAAPLARAPHGPLMGRIWGMRDNLTPYDAAYVALAELLDTVLVTADNSLASAFGMQCEVELLAVTH
jgi:predicted nucleic acid-binding protein